MKNESKKFSDLFTKAGKTYRMAAEPLGITVAALKIRVSHGFYPESELPKLAEVLGVTTDEIVATGIRMGKSKSRKRIFMQVNPAVNAAVPDIFLAAVAKSGSLIEAANEGFYKHLIKALGNFPSPPRKLAIGLIESAYQLLLERKLI